ncbi:signal peptidase I [Thermococcus gorgonarius]|uniref:Peptidase S26 domain-containing protein n=1 Tax=Thermococcus gorgonarius TaxID=71997 RepID=A0A2Z2M6U8_THEGO|nr:signal peptidase I [Thermococcus gorgonarius]ASJ01386.1 hypothetical protein A3K92_07780 [Thermococcus gorgonarius]
MKIRSIILLVIILLLLPVIPYLTRLTPMVVLSGSMIPYFNPGDIVLLEKTDPAQVEVGDVVAFHPPNSKDETTFVTHRVVDIVEENGTRYFKTKGDNNGDEDPFLVPQENVYGKAVFSIPKLGFLTRHNPDKRARFLFYLFTILVPGMAVVLTELPKILHYSPKLDRQLIRLSLVRARSREVVLFPRLGGVFLVSLIFFTLLLSPSIEDGRNTGRLPVLVLRRGVPDYELIRPGEELVGDYDYAVNSVLPVMWVVRLYEVNPFILRGLNLILSLAITILAFPLWLKEEPNFRIVRRRNKYVTRRA